MNLAAIFTGASVLSVGAGMYMMNNSSQGDDTLGTVLTMGGAYGMFGGGAKWGINSIQAARAAETTARMPFLPLALASGAALGAGLLGKRIAGGGDAKPIVSVQDMVDRAVDESELMQDIGGGKTPDADKLREYYEGFDDYDGYGAEAGDGMLSQADMSTYYDDIRGRTPGGGSW